MPAFAQGSDCYTFHLYVDPLYGDDAYATAQNPPTGTGILGTHPDAPPPIKIAGVLTHAPYSFRTLTGPSGAVAWVALRFDSIPKQFGSRTVEAVVIHCLPGLYGPRLNGQTQEIDQDCGLPWNGESFPVVLQDGVSLRGTSALDTILDARGQQVNVIEVEAPLGFETHAADLITQLTIRGAHTPAAAHGGPLAGSLKGAGVYVHGRGRADVTIANCFVVGNHVGIGVDAEIDDPPLPGEQAHRVAIINNTIAWNVVGVWNGNTGAAPSVGESFTLMLNNIVDHNAPGPPFPVGYSDLEGVDYDDTTVGSIITTPNPITLTYDTNAYSQPGFVNQGAALPPLILVWPPTSPRGADPSIPVVDLVGFGLGDTAGAPRNQALFVADVLRLSPLAPGDYSPHDLRLAPRVRTVQGGWATTPFVNTGLQTQTLAPGTTPGRIIMKNGEEIPLLNGSGAAWGPGANMDAPATLDFWDWDAEGFGNPRVEARVNYGYGPLVPPAAQPYASIDLGADELGDLVIAGYLPDTRIFADAVRNAAAATPHRTVFFLNYDPVNPTAPFPRPVMNAIVGGRYPDTATPEIYYSWWEHVQDQTNSISPTVNYTEGAKFMFGSTISERRHRVTTGGRLPFMRNLFCDHSPHLILDPHPQWGKLWDAYSPTARPGDIYATHPWMDSPSEGDLDNPFLFDNVRGFPNSTTQWFTGQHWPTVGIVNPPGTDGPALTMSFPWDNWLAGGYPTMTFGPFLPCQGGVGSQYVVDGLTGLGDVSINCPDQLPLVPEWFMLGVRINCEGRDAAQVKDTNLQTLLMVIQAPPNDTEEAFAGTGTITQEALRASRRRREAQR